MNSLSSFINIFISIFLCFFSSSCSASKSSFEIIHRPIKFTNKRLKLTKAYMKERYKLNTHLIQPQMIIIHWTAVNSLENMFQAFNNEELHVSRKVLNASRLNVSAHFLVSKEGKIYQLMPDNFMARHCIGLNHLAIGIENMGGVGGREDLTYQQVIANAQLIEHLQKKYPSIEYVIGHYEYLNFEHSKLWKEKPDTPRTDKIDPGPKFMKKLRKALRHYNFLSSPKPV